MGLSVYMYSAKVPICISLPLISCELYAAESAMQSYSSLSSGQNYTNIVLNVYKSQNHKVVLSSFESFNVNVRSFQQNPWMANIAGAPLWSQSGIMHLRIPHEFFFVVIIAFVQ